MKHNDMVFFLMNSYYIRHMMLWAFMHETFRRKVRPMAKQLKVSLN